MATKNKKQVANPSMVIDTIVRETLARHAGLDEKEYLKRIGQQTSKRLEGDAVRIAKYNAMAVIMKLCISMTQKFNDLNDYFKVYVKEEDIYKKENENGKNDKN